jgi:hypothetical protein
MRTDLDIAVEHIVTALDFGKPTAVKRGRNPQYPYVPVIDHGEVKIGRHMTRSEQIKGYAFPSRELAVEHAGKVISARRTSLVARLKEPHLRALRQSYGLPAEITGYPPPIEAEMGGK